MLSQPKIYVTASQSWDYSHHPLVWVKTFEEDLTKRVSAFTLGGWEPLKQQTVFIDFKDSSSENEGDTTGLNMWNEVLSQVDELATDPLLNKTCLFVVVNPPESMVTKIVDDSMQLTERHKQILVSFFSTEEMHPANEKVQQIILPPIWTPPANANSEEKLEDTPDGKNAQETLTVTENQQHTVASPNQP